MASKLQFISELASHTAQTVTRDVDGWKRYLATASRLYKYRFDEQLLIYAQRPDATACASMELWNDTMRRCRSTAPCWRKRWSCGTTPCGGG